MKNNKGQGLALRTVVVLVILLITLMVIVGFFFGATGKVFSPLTDLLTGSTEELPGECVSKTGAGNCGVYTNRADCIADENCRWKTV